jgi:hypothetical protein
MDGMQRSAGLILGAMVWLATGALAHAQADVRPEVLEQVYSQWRNALMTRNVAAWQAATASHRQGQVRNRLVSERRAYPAAVFEVPAAPPALAGLRRVMAKQVGRTAKLSYFGKVDFGVGGEPTDNLFVVSFVQEGAAWKFDAADFVSLAALPAERAEIGAGNLSYLDETADFAPSGVVPPVPAAVPAPKYLAKVYIYAPGRDVQVVVNELSNHRVVNDREADIVIGGARDGANRVSWAITNLPGATGKEAMTIRVYLLSEVQGVKPVKAFEYQVDVGQVPQLTGADQFTVDAAIARTLAGQ